MDKYEKDPTKWKEIPVESSSVKVYEEVLEVNLPEPPVYYASED